MKTKLHFGILVILLAFLGTYLEESKVPNQQIVIQFSNNDIAEEEAESAIESVKLQLLSIGVEQLEIVHSDDGQLKITYYSDSGVERIQNILSNEEGFKFAYDSSENNSTNFPENKNVNDYEFNISEIQKTDNINWDFERTEVVELNHKSDSSYTYKVKTSEENINTKRSNSIVKVAFQVHHSIAIAMDNFSYKIPEVRAGPTAKGII